MTQTAADLEATISRLAGRLFLNDMGGSSPYSLRNVARMTHAECARRAALFTEGGASLDYRPLAEQAYKVLVGFDSLCPPVLA